MKTKLSLLFGFKFFKSGAPCVVALLAVGLANAGLQVFGQASNVTTNSYGSGKHYKTSVERRSEGDLSAEDLHQASLLTSQLLTHVNEAAQHLTDSRAGEARAEIEKAQSLVKVVRALLPTTVVTTSVKDAQGKEIYRDEKRVQEDQIPIYSGEVAVEVVDPIIEAKSDEAALKGVKHAQAEVVRTAVLVDLNYVERKLKRAVDLISKPSEAAAELALAQTTGVHFYARKEDSPLVDAQYALRLAERMVAEKRYESAKANLQTAKLNLEAYRTLAGVSSAPMVADLEKDIQRLSGELQAPGAGETIRGMWDKVAGFFKREPGQAHQTTNSIPQPLTASNKVEGR